MAAGAHVRFRAYPDTVWHVGLVRHASATELVIESGADSVGPLPFGRVELEQRAGWGSASGNIALGAVAGGLTGLAWTLLTARNCNHGKPEEGLTCGAVVVVAPIASVLGVAIGATFGALLPPRRWVPVR